MRTEEAVREWYEFLVEQLDAEEMGHEGVRQYQSLRTRARSGVRRGPRVTTEFISPAEEYTVDASSGGPKRQRGPIQGGKHARPF